MEEKTYYVAETTKGYIHRMLYGFYTDSFDDAHKIYDGVEVARATFDRKTKDISYKLLKITERTERIIDKVE